MATDLRDTALNPNMPMRRDQLAQMTATPRSPRLGFLADTMMALKEFANRVQVPAGVPLLGGEGVGSLLLGKAPEELVEMSYGNMPMRINPYAGQTASFVPEMKPGRGAQVADLLSLAPTPGGARAAAGLAGMADMGGMERALIGYHGTPHRFAAEEGAPLGRFRSEKIGTGEGAQAYGYGTYFAESPGVAKGYREQLADTLEAPEDAPLMEKRLAQVALNYGGGNVKGAMEWLNKYRNAEGILDEPLVAAVVKKLKTGEFSPGGSLYTVDIPDEMIGKMLDYDKPLGQQAPEVREAIKAASESPMLRHLSKSIFGDDVDVRNLLDRLSLAWRRDYGRGGEPEVVEVLRQAGIPGIRYLDQGSRGVGDGTRNIVVFPGEEQNVKILSRE